MEKNQKRDKNMAKVMTQLDILSKKIMGVGNLSVHTVVVGCANLKEAKL